jgi:hypothetical protein
MPDAFNEWWDADYDDAGNAYCKDSPAYWAWAGWKAASKQPEQEPVSMRMPKAGDKVICLEDESLATVVSLTAGGSPDIVFSDGSRGTYLLHEFAELFGYTTPPAAQRKPQYNKTEMNCFVQNLYDEKMREGKHGHYEAMFHVVHRAIEAAHGIKENT